MGAGRIRSIKPEVLDDEALAGVTDAAWRLLIGARALADDYGNVRAGARYLAASIWQDTGRTDEIPELLEELASAGLRERGEGLILVYTVKGEPYFHIVGWDREGPHSQRMDNAGSPRVPGLDQVDPQTSLPFLRETRRLAAPIPISDPDLRSPIPDTSARARESEPVSEPTSSPPGSAASRPLDPIGRPTKRQRELVARHRESADLLLGVMSEERMRVIAGARPIRPTWIALAGIAARLDDGHTVEECQQVIRSAAADVAAGGDPKWFNYETLFRPANFERRLQMGETAIRPAGRSERSASDAAGAGTQASRKKAGELF